ncbi:hypothetical protein D3Z58_08360 [Clostridiaceae bacterium]|nr:hypothetical protein [Clostridiaceae bacterium]
MLQHSLGILFVCYIDKAPDELFVDFIVIIKLFIDSMVAIKLFVDSMVTIQLFGILLSTPMGISFKQFSREANIHFYDPKNYLQFSQKSSIV